MLQFDSICQKIDLEKKGFVSTLSVLRAFQQLTPLCDKLQTDNQALFLNLFTLSAAVNRFAELKLPFSEAFLAVIQGGVGCAPSFAKFLAKEKSAFSVERFGVASVSAQTAVEDVKVLEEQLFAADLLGELTRELAKRLHASSHIDWRAVNNTSECQH